MRKALTKTTIATLIILTILSSSKCYSQSENIKTPFNKTPLYKHLMEKSGMSEKSQSEDDAEQKQIKQDEKKTVAEEDTTKPTTKLTTPVPTITHSQKPFYKADKPVYTRLDEIVDLSGLTPQMPFSEAIELLQHSVNPPINIIVLWDDLERNAEIYRDSPVYIDGISGVPLETSLKLLLIAVSAVELDYVVDESSIIIATKYSLPHRMITEIYGLSDVLAESANYRSLSLGGIRSYSGRRGNYGSRSRFGSISYGSSLGISPGFR